MTAPLARLLTLALGVLFLVAGPAFAHEGEPLRSTEVRVGPHEMTVHYFNEPRGGQPLVFSIETGGVPDSTTFELTAVPGAATPAVPVRATFTREGDELEGQVLLPVSGQWLLEITADLPGGTRDGTAGVLAGAPPAIPVWLGWLVGLIPAGAMMLFVLGTARSRGRGHALT